MIYKGALSLAAMAILIHTTGSIVWASAGVAIAWLVRFLTFDVRITAILPTAESAKSWDWTQAPSLLKLTLPLGLVMLLIALNNNIPRYFIQHEMGERAVGFYSAIAYLMVAGTTVVSALGQSASPRLAREYAHGNVAAFRLLLGKLVLVAIGLGGVGILLSSLFGGPILALVYAEEYAAHAGLLTLLMIAALVVYPASFLGYGMTAARYFHAQLPLFMIVTSTSLLASYLLIPRHGLIGAAAAVILSAIVSFVGASAINYIAVRPITR
jgi:O-antigen/teichoic acid export membrane protein